MKGRSRSFDAASKAETRVLVMEDDCSLAQGLKRTLVQQGCTVELAHTGVGALDHCMREGFELLVADLRLPDRDGMEIIRLVKEKRPGMQVLVITGYASIQTVVESFRCGACDYLPKPFTEAQFKAAVTGALTKKKGAFPVGSGPGREARLVQRREVVRVLDTSPLRSLFWHEFMDEHPGLMEEVLLFREAGTDRGTTWTC